MHCLEKVFLVEVNNNLIKKELELFLMNIAHAKLVFDPFYQNDLTKIFFIKNKSNSIGKI
jgi:hypothetical protein